MAQNSNPSWLVMVYLAGDNNLSDEMVLAMQDLVAEGPPAEDKIVAQFDPSGVGLSTQRFDFSVPKTLCLEDYSEPYKPTKSNTGSKANLVDFIKWAHGFKSYGTGRRHLLILAGHGSGATEDFFLKDESSMDALTVDELRDALEEAREIIGKRVDILGIDACFMNMAEIAYELRRYVNIVVGAEGPEPAFGWPYRRILSVAKKHRETNPPMDPEELAYAIVHNYVEHYADYEKTAGRSVDLSAIRLRRTNPYDSCVDDVADAFGGLVEKLSNMSQRRHEQLLLAHWHAQTYKFEQFVDLRDLCMEIRRRFTGPVKRRAEAVVAAINDCVILAGCSGFGYQHSYGLSIYFPWACVSPDYRNLRFANKTGWLNVLRTHLQRTRRVPRRGYKTEPIRPLQRLLKISMENTSVALSPVETAIVNRLRGLSRLPKVGSVKQWDRVGKAVNRLRDADIGGSDLPLALTRRVVGAGVPRDPNHRYTGEGSRYTGEGSRYTGEGSRYTGEGSRSPSDRGRAVKNLPPVFGKAYWPREA